MRVAVWGAGKAGRYLASLRTPVHISMAAFIDRDKSLQGTYIEGLPVLAPKQEMIAEFDAILVCTISIFKTAEIINRLQKMNAKKIGYFSSETYENVTLWSNLRWVDTGKVFFPYVETHISDICNLKCVGCTHFSSLFSDNKEIRLEYFKSDLQVLKKNATLYRLRLLGGEPLLSDSLDEYVRSAREIFPSTDIHLVTNGLLLCRQSEEFFSLLRELEVVLDISSYKPTMHHRSKIENLLKVHRVPYKFSQPIKMFTRFMNLSGRSDISRAYDKCHQKSCTFLRNGRLYSCPLDGLVQRFAKYFGFQEKRMTSSRESGFDIYSPKLDWFDLYDKLHQPFSLCAYCSERGGEEFPWSVSSEPLPKDWFE